MNDYSSIRDQQCPNKKCSLYGIRFGNKVVIHSKKDGRFKCSDCGRTWVEHKNDLYFGLRVSREKIELALVLYEAGRSVREIAREVQISPSTVQRWKSIFDSKI